MSVPLKIYRVYCFDGERMNVTGDLIEAANDEEAIAEAQRLCIGWKYEIWEGTRLVAGSDGDRRQA